MQFQWWMWIPVGMFVLWVLLNLKTSRPDGTMVKNVPAFRRMLGMIMPTRNESVVYFDEFINAENLVEYLKVAGDKIGANMTHATVAAASIGLIQTPRMNQFVVGRRIYDRKGRYITFSMLRKKKDRKAKLSAVKLEILADETFAGLCERVNAQVNVERSGKKTYADKELNLFNLLPRSVLRLFVTLFKTLDYYNLLPGAFIKNDGMYTSIFLANLGSIGMRPGYHHLFEWGTCPLFLMIGRVEEVPAVVDGKIVPQKMMQVRFSFEERIDDGLNARYGIDCFKRVLEDPFTYLGCVADDGSDVKPLETMAEEDRKAREAKAA